MPESNQKSILREFFGFLRVIVVSLLIIVPIRAFVAQPFIVKGLSMHPSYENGEYLIVDELTYQFRDPKRGEVIVFRYPRDPSQFFIKRVIGLPGETVIVDNGMVFIKNEERPDGFRLIEIYLPEGLSSGVNKTLVLGDGQYAVFGDNRDESFDSRMWGEVPDNLIVGRTMLRLWPPDRIGIPN